MSNVLEQDIIKFVPHRVQEQFFRLPFEIFEALYGGAAGGGKSESLVILPLAYRWHEHPKFKGILLRRTMPELEREIIPRSRNWYGPSGAEYNETKKVWKWPSGATMWFGHAEQESSIRKYDGVEYNYIAWDEATSFLPSQYEYLFSRARSSTPDLPSIIRAATNPGGIGHEYFRRRFVEPFRLGFKTLKYTVKVHGELKVKYRIFIPCLGKDNPHLLRNTPEYLANLALITNEAERKAKLDGDWWTFEGQVFKEFRTEPFSDEPENACHVIDSVEIPSWWPRVLAIDWGFAANTSMGWAAISPNGRLYIYRTYNEKTKYIAEWTRDAINLSKGEEIKDIVICHSAGQNRGEPLTILQQAQEAFTEAGFDAPIRLGERDRIGGKLMVHEYLRWRPKPSVKDILGNFDPTLSERIYRIHGEDKYREYLNMFVPEKTELNLPKLQILRETPEGASNQMLIDAIGNCIYDDNRIEDVAEFDGDDPYDMLRMLLSSAEFYKNSIYFDQSRHGKIQEAIKQLETGNATSFYRRMEKIEADADAEPISVRRSSRFRRR